MKNVIRKLLREEINTKVTKLQIFDLDGTTIETPLPDDKNIWESKNKKPWNWNGFWFRPESLDPSFKMPLVKSTNESYKKSISNPNSLTVLITGRSKKIFENRVREILGEKGIKFDEYFFNTDGRAFDVKIEQIENLLERYPNIKNVEMWDDRIEHLEGFKEWADTKDVELKTHFVKSSHNIPNHHINEDIRVGTSFVKSDFEDKEFWSYLKDRLMRQLNLKKFNFMSSGNYGNVFDIGDNKVLKVTRDESESKTVTSLVGKDLKYVINYHNVHKLVSKKIHQGLWLIIMEKVDFRDVTGLFEELTQVIELYLKGKERRTRKGQLPQNIGKQTEGFEFLKVILPEIVKGGLTKELYELGSFIMEKGNRDLYELYFFIVNLNVELNRQGIEYLDIKPDNIGLRNGKYVAFDLGMSFGGRESTQQITIDEVVIDEV